MSIRVLVNGAQGRMGQETVKAIQAEQDLLLVGSLGRQDNLARAIAELKPKVVVDFTLPDSVYNNTKTILECGAHPVIGTSGLSVVQLEELHALAKKLQIGGIIAPNFSIGAVLMMQFAAAAIKYFPHAEIIEMHHDKKIDAPSGTAVKTATMMAQSRLTLPDIITSQESITGVRGGHYEQIPIHSVRLPGMVAHQAVIFGGDSESLTLRHDSIHRASFMPGVILACRTVQGLSELKYGLENVM